MLLYKGLRRKASVGCVLFKDKQFVESFSTEKNEISVIMMELGPEDTRVCDFCDEVLIVWDDDELNKDGVKKRKNALVVKKRCHSTSCGLICDSCKGDIESLKTYEVNEVVRVDKLGNIEKIDI